MQLTAMDFNYLRTLVHQSSGVFLEDNKRYLIESRLGPVAEDAGLGSLARMVTQLRAGATPQLRQRVVEAMMTHETLFFRDQHPFEGLRTVVLPELLRKRASQRCLNIWSAACSSGQEPYSIALVIREGFGQLMDWRVHLVASDLSTETLRHAKQGLYSSLEVNRGLPTALRDRYFERRGAQWQIRSEIQKMVEFRQINLASHWPPLGKMDIVFMRNVLIYFDIETKKQILGKLRRILAPDGYLFLGNAETTLNLDDTFKRIPCGRASCYRLGN